MNILNDTDAATEEFWYSLLATLTPEEKLERIFNLCRFGRELMLLDIKEKYPQATPLEIRKLFAIRVLGKEFVEKHSKDFEV